MKRRPRGFPPIGGRRGGLARPFGQVRLRLQHCHRRMGHGQGATGAGFDLVVQVAERQGERLGVGEVERAVVGLLAQDAGELAAQRLDLRDDLPGVRARLEVEPGAARAAVEAGGRDNVTVVVVNLDGDVGDDLSETSPRATGDDTAPRGQLSDKE